MRKQLIPNAFQIFDPAFCRIKYQQLAHCQSLKQSALAANRQAVDYQRFTEISSGKKPDEILATNLLSTSYANREWPIKKADPEKGPALLSKKGGN